MNSFQVTDTGRPGKEPNLIILESLSRQMQVTQLVFSHGHWTTPVIT